MSDNTDQEYENLRIWFNRMMDRNAFNEPLAQNTVYIKFKRPFRNIDLMDRNVREFIGPIIVSMAKDYGCSFVLNGSNQSANFVDEKKKGKAREFFNRILTALNGEPFALDQKRVGSLKTTYQP